MATEATHKVVLLRRQEALRAADPEVTQYVSADGQWLAVEEALMRKWQLTVPYEAVMFFYF